MVGMIAKLPMASRSGKIPVRAYGTPAPLQVFPHALRETSCARRGIARLSNFDGYNDCRAAAWQTDADDMASFQQQIDLLSRLISASEMRQQVIGHNIANVNTPNYHRLDVNFEQALADELARAPASGAAAKTAAPTVHRSPGLPARADGNNVDIDQEIGALNKNALLQQVYLQMVGAEMGMMRRAIDGR